MRTTVTLDPDVEALIRQRMRERGQTFKRVLNQALRSALGHGVGQAVEPFRQRTFAMGFRRELALDKALALDAAIEPRGALLDRPRLRALCGIALDQPAGLRRRLPNEGPFRGKASRGQQPAPLGLWCLPYGFCPNGR